MRFEPSHTVHTFTEAVVTNPQWRWAPVPLFLHCSVAVSTGTLIPALLWAEEDKLRRCCCAVCCKASSKGCARSLSWLISFLSQLQEVGPIDFITQRNWHSEILLNFPGDKLGKFVSLRTLMKNNVGSHKAMCPFHKLWAKLSSLLTYHLSM